MGMRPRWIRSDHVIASTQRTVDRQFLFRPDPRVCNLIGASAIRAGEKNPVNIYWLEFNINHEQNGIAPISESREHRNNVIHFKQTFHRLIAEGLNDILGREGAVYSTPSRSIDCLDDMSVQQQFFYAMTNVVKDGLVDKVSHWKGFSSYAQLAAGKDIVFTWYDRTAWNKQKHRKNAKPLSAFVRRGRIEYAALPGMEHMSLTERQRYIRREVRILEDKFRAERELEGRSVMPPEKLEKVDPRSRPRNPKERTKMPLCHCSCPVLAARFEAELKEFLAAYWLASAAYRAGNYYVDFPMGSCRPPLIELAA